MFCEAIVGDVNDLVEKIVINRASCELYDHLSHALTILSSSDDYTVDNAVEFETKLSQISYLD